MTVNEYGNETFFEEYAKITRSQQGLAGAGEWRMLQPLFQDFVEQARLGYRLRLWLALQVRCGAGRGAGAGHRHQP